MLVLVFTVSVIPIHLLSPSLLDRVRVQFPQRELQEEQKDAGVGSGVFVVKCMCLAVCVCVGV